MEYALIAAALLGLIPASIASSRGRDFGSWWIFGAGLFIVALPMALMIKAPAKQADGDKPPAAGATVPIWVAVTVIIFAIGAAFLFSGPSNQTQKAESRQDQISMAGYLALKNGMPYEQAVTILGQPGEELSRNEMPGIPGVMARTETVMYMWGNSNGSNMNAMFQNNKLIQKAQTGLK